MSHWSIQRTQNQKCHIWQILSPNNNNNEEKLWRKTWQMTRFYECI